jgi:hypothetical protein
MFRSPPARSTAAHLHHALIDGQTEMASPQNIVNAHGHQTVAPIFEADGFSEPGRPQFPGERGKAARTEAA